jgi:hypothetical protein
MQSNTFISIAAIVIALSLGYYYVMYLPARDARNDTHQGVALEQQNRIDCSQIAAQYVQTENADKVGLSVGLKIFDYKVHYNTKINACLISYYFTGADYAPSAKVVNLYTHETLAAMKYTYDSMATFQAAEKELMSE